MREKNNEWERSVQKERAQREGRRGKGSKGKCVQVRETNEASGNPEAMGEERTKECENFTQRGFYVTHFLACSGECDEVLRDKCEAQSCQERLTANLPSKSNHSFHSQKIIFHHQELLGPLSRKFLAAQTPSLFV